MQYFSKIRALKTGTKITGLIILVSLIGGGYLYWNANRITYQFVSVKKGSLTERVDLTGSVAPVDTASLAFQNSGTISKVYKQVGDKVSAGTVLAKLDTRDLKTQLASAKANVEVAEAKLNSLTTGATPATIKVSETSLDMAQKALTGDYMNAVSVIIDSYSKATDAVRTKLNIFFTNPETQNPILIFTSSAGSTVRETQYERGNLNNLFSTWNKQVETLSSKSSSPKEIRKALSVASKNLSTIARFLNNLTTVTINASSFPAGLSLTKETAKSTVATSVSKINMALKNIVSANNVIKNQEALVALDRTKLAQTLEPATKENIAIAKADVDSAQAKYDAILIQISKSLLRSPIRGVVSVQDAKVGQTVQANRIVAKVFSSNELEVDVTLPEVDTGKVSVGDDIDITFDAFPNKVFTGKVFSIDPAETVTSGVVGYKTKIHFTKQNPLIKSGLTANVSIVTTKKENVLILPQYSLLQTDDGTFVEVLRHGKATRVLVNTGIRDDSGNVEITSGITDNERVITMGLKSES